MAGKMVNLLSLLNLLIICIGLALAQTQTQTQTQTATTPATTPISADTTGTMDITSTVSVVDATTAAADGTTKATASQTTLGEVITRAGDNATVTSQHTRKRTGLPTTTIPNPLRHNAGRKPSQPGLGKLSVVVGLVTYGLILM